MKVTGAQTLQDALKHLGIKQIFAYPHDSLTLLIEGLETSKMPAQLTRKPENTVYMSDGFARVTGEPGVAIVPPGANAAQVLPGLLTAYHDSVPLICLTFQVPSQVIGTDAYQELDTIGITQSCTKHNYLVKDVQNLPKILKEAHYLATSGRPGPVLIDLPEDFLEQFLDSQDWDESPTRLKGYKVVTQGHNGQIRKSIERLLKAEKPLIYVGGGAVASGAHAEILDLAETLQVPVATTLTGLGAFPTNNPLSLQLIGRNGTAYGNLAASSADVILALGTRFNPHVMAHPQSFHLQASIIQVDIDPSCISRYIPVDVPVVGDLKQVLLQFLEELKGQKAEIKKSQDLKQPWIDQIQTWKTQSPSDKPSPAADYLIALDNLARDKSYVTCSESGLQILAATHFRFSEPRHCCFTAGVETPGYGVNAAIGAHRADPKKHVVCLTSPSDFLANTSDLETACQNQMPLKVILFQPKTKAIARNKVTSYCDLFESYGGQSFVCADVPEFESAYKKSMRSKKPVLFHMEVPAWK